MRFSSQLATGELVELPVDGMPLDRPWHAVTQPESPASTELLVRELFDAGWSAATELLDPT